jgi:aminoglycoside phosphotransferase (APT) family kinase protein
MNARSTGRAHRPEQGLRRALEPLLANAIGRHVAVEHVTREVSPFITRSTVEVLAITLRDGSRLSLFLKQLGSAEPDHPDKQLRDREIRIYQEFFQEPELPVVKYFGCRWNGRSRRHEVFLEFVNDWNLKYQHLEHWFTAARRLAQLHAHFAARADTLNDSPSLLRLDRTYLRDWAQRGHAAVAEQAPDLAAALAPVIDRYDEVADLVCRQPVTLVHNDLAPKNVLADRSSSPARICFIDWEMSGVGCGVLDLVHLKHGLDPASDRQMCDVYCRELENTGLLPASEAERECLFAACALHQTLYRLAHLRAWSVSLAMTAAWVAEARDAMTRVLAGSQRCTARPLDGAR